MQFVSVNGHPIPPSAEAIAPTDRGFTLGDGLFETIKLEAGIAWYLARHVARLERGANRLGLLYPPQLREWIDAAIRASDANHATATLVLRITLTRGNSQTHGLAGDSSANSTVVITIAPAPQLSNVVYDTGITARIASAPRNERAFSAGLKTTSYIESILALREARAAGYDDSLFLDTHGFVSELSASNLFLWSAETLVTPSLDNGMLPGITREVIMECAATANIPVEERMVSLDQFFQAHEAFATSSLRGIVPLTHVNDIPIGTGTPGSRTRRMMDLYATQVTRV